MSFLRAYCLIALLMAGVSAAPSARALEDHDPVVRQILADCSVEGIREPLL